jgi:hypothetical protein
VSEVRSLVCGSSPSFVVRKEVSFCRKVGLQVREEGAGGGGGVILLSLSERMHRGCVSERAMNA